MTDDQLDLYYDYLQRKLPHSKAQHVVRYGAYGICGYSDLESWLAENTDLSPRDILRCLNHGAGRVHQPSPITPKG